jgi:hypothetical protein
LNEARAVVVLWSQGSVVSSFVLDEASVGQKRGVLVPVSLDDAPAPLGFGQTHTLALRNWNGDAADAQVRAIATACARGAPASPGGKADSKVRAARFGRLSLWPSICFSAALGAAGGVTIGFEDLARGELLGAPGAFWLIRALAGITMVGGIVFVARWLFAAAQALAGWRARGFFDPAFLVLCAVSLLGGLTGAVTIGMGAQPVLSMIMVSALTALSLAIAALPASLLVGRLRAR